MDLYTIAADLGVALALGLLVGLQRERAGSAVAGIRTFAFLALFGALTPTLAGLTKIDWAGPVLIAAGLLCVVALAYIGNISRAPSDQSPGVTTEIAMLVVYAAGVLCGLHQSPLAAIIGGCTVVLLHLKPPLQRFTAALSDEDVRAIMQFAVISLIILPIVPDRAMGPYDAFNPRDMWLLVVLVIAISLAAYVAQRVRGERQGLLLTGLLGGLVSSTATTAAVARRVRMSPTAGAVGAIAVFLATSVLYVRVFVELYAVSRPLFHAMCVPLGILFAVCLGSAGLAYLIAPRDGMGELPPSKNPSELKSALFFAGMFALVQLLSAAAHDHLGGRGVYAVAAFAGLTDLDAITLSSGRLHAQGQLGVREAAGSVLIALASNLIFKTVLASVLGGTAMLKRIWWLTAINIGACAVVGAMWWARLGASVSP